MTDGVYSDAEFRDGCAGLGVVRMVGGQLLPPHFKAMYTSDSHQAEIAAAKWAMELYPGVPLFMDNASAAELLGATWIPRNQNRAAHKAARKGYVSFFGQHVLLGTKRKKLYRFRGRGVVPAGEKRLAFG